MYLSFTFLLSFFHDKNTIIYSVTIVRLPVQFWRLHRGLHCTKHKRVRLFTEKDNNLPKRTEKDRKEQKRIFRIFLNYQNIVQNIVFIKYIIMVIILLLIIIIVTKVKLSQSLFTFGIFAHWSFCLFQCFEVLKNVSW